MILEVHTDAVRKALAALGIEDAISVRSVTIGPEAVTVHRMLLIDGEPQMDGTGQLILGELSVPITGRDTRFLSGGN